PLPAVAQLTQRAGGRTAAVLRGGDPRGEEADAELRHLTLSLGDAEQLRAEPVSGRAEPRIPGAGLQAADGAGEPGLLCRRTAGVGPAGCVYQAQAQGAAENHGHAAECTQPGYGCGAVRYEQPAGGHGSGT